MTRRLATAAIFVSTDEEDEHLILGFKSGSLITVHMFYQLFLTSAGELEAAVDQIVPIKD
jgi:hypothetical protein